MSIIYSKYEKKSYFTNNHNKMNKIPNIDEIKENLKFTDQLLKLNEIKENDILKLKMVFKKKKHC